MNAKVPTTLFTSSSNPFINIKYTILGKIKVLCTQLQAIGMYKIKKEKNCVMCSEMIFLRAISYFNEIISFVLLTLISKDKKMKCEMWY